MGKRIKLLNITTNMLDVLKSDKHNIIIHNRHILEYYLHKPYIKSHYLMPLACDSTFGMTFIGMGFQKGSPLRQTIDILYVFQVNE